MTSAICPIIVTAYHFDRSEPRAFERLKTSLKSSHDQISRHGRLILVASGDKAIAAEPASIVTEVFARFPCNIFLELVPGATRNVHALNAGMRRAVGEASKLKTPSYIASIQSSAVIQPNWVKLVTRAFEADTRVNGVASRIVKEEEPERIWTDGHQLRRGMTEFRFPDSRSDRLADEFSRAFPCLSACAFRTNVVENVIATFNEFVSECFDHYGDCPDVAFRISHVDKLGHFVFEDKAVAHKRQPWRDTVGEAAWLLASSEIYYRKKADCEERKLKMLEQVMRRTGLDDLGMAKAKEKAATILGRSYCGSGHPPPSADAFESDASWR